MHDVAGKVAVVTGGGGLLGRGMAVQFAAAAMHVVVSDVDGAAAEAVAAEVRERGGVALAVRTDVSDPGAVEELAAAAYTEFGAVHLLCNNAGARVFKPVPELTVDDWRHVLSVNLDGVIHGLVAFLPRLMAQGGERHIVNTASMSGVGLGELRPLHAPYVTSKFAVVGLTETIRPVLAEHGIGVSVLCPGLVRAEETGVPLQPSANLYSADDVGPEDVGDIVLQAVRENRSHIFTHPSGLQEVEQRHELLLAAFRQAGATV